jgi:hypothetical protein
MLTEIQRKRWKQSAQEVKKKQGKTEKKIEKKGD